MDNIENNYNIRPADIRCVFRDGSRDKDGQNPRFLKIVSVT
uniref:Uncharacterized protein n=1 Tax=Romanomermis culicivorax TaxID=13658 RepID=A0A915L9I2_ROMCU